MIKKIWATLTGGQLVWLEDHDQEITLAIARKTPFGDWQATRWWPFGGGVVRLLPDGTTAGLSYVKRWRPNNSSGVPMWNGSIE